MSALFIIVGLGAFAALCWRQLWWGVVALIALTPLYLVRFTFIVIPTTFLEVCIYIAVAVWLVRWFQRSISMTGIGKYQLWFLNLWLSIGLVAAFHSPDIREAYGAWKAYCIDPLLFVILFLTTITTRERIYRALWSAGSAVLLLAVVAIWQSLGLIPSPEPWISQMPPRVASVFDYPNALGLFVAPIVGLFLPAALGVGQWSGRRRRFAWAVVIGGTLAAVLAVSQGAWFGIAAAAVLTVMFLPRRWRTLGVGLAVMALVLTIPTVRHQLIDLVTFHDTSGDVRRKLWQGTIRLLHDHPINGAGLTGFPSMYNIYRDASHVELLLYPHNIFLNFWATLGLPGLIAALTLLVYAFERLARVHQTAELGAIRVGVMAALVALIVHGLVDVPYFKNDLAILFWFLIALSHQLYRLNKNS